MANEEEIDIAYKEGYAAAKMGRQYWDSQYLDLETGGPKTYGNWCRGYRDYMRNKQREDWSKCDLPDYSKMPSNHGLQVTLPWYIKLWNWIKSL